MTRLVRDAVAAQAGTPHRIAELRAEGDDTMQRLVEAVDAQR